MCLRQKIYCDSNSTKNVGCNNSYSNSTSSPSFWTHQPTWYESVYWSEIRYSLPALCPPILHFCHYHHNMTRRRFNPKRCQIKWKSVRSWEIFHLFGNPYKIKQKWNDGVKNVWTSDKSWEPGIQKFEFYWKLWKNLKKLTNQSTFK